METCLPRRPGGWGWGEEAAGRVLAPWGGRQVGAAQGRVSHTNTAGVQCLRVAWGVGWGVRGAFRWLESRTQSSD